jgi:vacuolar-type H+-ATPase subunit E/Vma4
MKPLVFGESVLRAVVDKSTAGMAQMQAEYDTAIKAAAESALAQAQERLAAESIKISLNSHKKTAAAFNQCKRELIELRSRLADALFESVRQELYAFAQTPDYRAYLAGKINRHNNEIFAYVQIMERDAAMVEDASDLSVEYTTEDFVGGFRLWAADRKTMADYTLQSALDEQRALFSQLYTNALSHERH